VPAVVDPVRPPEVPVKPVVPEPKVIPEPKVVLEPKVASEPPQSPSKRPAASPPLQPTSDDALAKAIPYVAFGSVMVTMVFVGLLFLRWKKGADKKLSVERVVIRHGKIESPSPTIIPTDPGAIRAADGPPKPFAAPTKPLEMPAKPLEEPAKPHAAPIMGGLPSLELDDDLPAKLVELPVKPPAAMEQRLSPGETPTTLMQRIAFFTGRMVTKPSQPLCRVYVLDDELLFLYAGPGYGDTAAGKGQALGGIVGAMIGKAVGAEMRERTKVRQRELDSADIAKLRQLARQDDSFRATAADFTSMSIDAIGFWNSLTVGPDCAAVLYAKHAERGNLTLALLTLDDARIATEELPKTLGNLVAVNVVWSNASLKFVKKG
jgi:hypothetical protein